MFSVLSHSVYIASKVLTFLCSCKGFTTVGGVPLIKLEQVLCGATWDPTEVPNVINRCVESFNDDIERCAPPPDMSSHIPSSGCIQ